MTLGMLSAGQAGALAEAGLDYYNHNIDTSPEFYPEIISTRCFQQRLDTLANVREAGMKVCCGGIVGMGEGREDRAGLLLSLATMPEHPESVPINLLVRVPGTPLEEQADLDPFEFVRTIAVARILMPASHVRLSAGRENMSDELQALAFFAGANSIFYGEKLLTTANPESERDMQLFRRLGLRPEERAPAATATGANRAPGPPTRCSTTPPRPEHARRGRAVSRALARISRPGPPPAFTAAAACSTGRRPPRSASTGANCSPSAATTTSDSRMIRA